MGWWAVCRRCEHLYERPYTKAKKLVDNPCPKCGGPGKGGVSPERYEEDRKKLKAWKKGAA